MIPCTSVLSQVIYYTVLTKPLYRKKNENKVISGYMPISPEAPHTLLVGVLTPCSRLPVCAWESPGLISMFLCALVLSQIGYLPYILPLYVCFKYSSYCIAYVYLYAYFIPICIFNCLFMIYSIITVLSTPVTTPYLYSLSVLYSHSLMKVAV